MNYRVTAITQSIPLYGNHQHITHISGDGWRLTREEAVRQIQAKQAGFYVQDSTTGKTAQVGVFLIDGVGYLRTYADGVWNDNLLALPRRAGSILTG